MTVAITTITHVAHVDAPSALRDLPGWLCWRYEPSDNPGGKPRKVPYYATGGRRAGQQGTPEDRAQLTTFAAARAAAARRNMDGVGFAPMADFGIVALDFDNCVTDGQIHPDILPALSSTYAEFSPSGNGIRAFCRGQLGNLKAHGAPFGFETFSSKGYVTFTGQVLDIVEVMGNTDTVAPVDDAVMSLVRQRFSRQLEPAAAVETDAEPLGLTPSQIAEALEVLPTDLDYDQWLTVGMALHHETQGQGFELWDEWSRRSPKYTTREYGLARWNSFARGTGPIVTARSLVHLANEHGAHISLSAPASAEDFEAIVEAQQDPAKPVRFQFQPASLFASAQALPWLIKGVLPRAGLAVVYGASTAGKSFAVLDIGMAVARGIAWRGRRTRQGRVGYIVAEGSDGFRKRLAAYEKHHATSLDGVPFFVLAQAPNLMELKDARDIVVGIRAMGGADVVVIDTFAQTMPGANENAGEDVGKALAHCRRIHEATGALVVLVHHSGKDQAKGARGWSGLRAAADAEIEVVRDATGRSLQLTKSKDGEDGTRWGFALDVVELGLDEDGDPITSCVAVEAELPVAARVGKPLGPNEVIVNDVIQEFAKAQSAGIEVAAVIAEAVKRMPAPEDGKRDTRKQRARRALETLTAGGEAPYWLGDDGCIEVL